MIKFLKLPDFLICLEEFNSIQDPPLKNLKRNEVSKAQGNQITSRIDDENVLEGRNKKRLFH
jgi:hypothetical protein